MNADERTPGQQSYGEQRPQDHSQHQQTMGPQHKPTEPENAASQGGSMSTGQASYGNSGEGGTDTLSQSGSGTGQDSDLGQTGQGRDTSLFSGADDDMGSSRAGTGRSGIDGSMNSGSDVGGSTGRSGIEGSLESSAQSTSSQTLGQQESFEQDFADQGQGALNQDPMGSDRKSGTSDVEMERSQGRESDIEGSSL